MIVKTTNCMGQPVSCDTNSYPVVTNVLLLCATLVTDVNRTNHTDTATSPLIRNTNRNQQ